jgi:signal recognition particle subunit SRP54
MFDSLQESLGSALKSLAGKAKLTEANMREGLGEVKQALLEADVNVGVVNDFIERVADQAVGEKVLKSLDPGQHVVGIVHKELVDLMGPVDHSLHLRADVTVLMLCGLQGSGKTTTCGKLAMMLKGRERKPMLVAADLQRPAAVHQLQVLGEQIGVPVYAEEGSKDPVSVCQNAVKEAKKQGADVVILDTAGRLHIDDELMQQLTRIDRRVNPEQVYLVVDGMTGQDAVNSAKAFNEALELDGLVMTKLDGDARGGAALSVKAITGVPIKYIGVGEHLDALEEFHPDRMAGRILGMGDMLTLVEQAQQKLDQDELAEQEERLKAGEFTLDDFSKLMMQTKKLGPLNKVMGMIPGMSGMSDAMADGDAEQEMNRLKGMIDSMTPDERRNPTKNIDQSRRRRIATGAGVESSEVKALIDQFSTASSVMKDMAGLGMRDRMKKVQQLSKAVSNPNARMGTTKISTGKRLSPKEKAKMRKQREKEIRRRKREQRKGPV